MERLLQEESDLMRNPEERGAGDFNGNPPEDHQELFNRMAAEMEPDDNQMAVDGDEDEDDEDDDDGEEDEECSNGSPGDEEAGEVLTNGVGEENHSNNSQLNEEWHSGNRQRGEMLKAMRLMMFQTLKSFLHLVR